MGSLCSRPDTHSGSHQVLGGGTPQSYQSTSDARAAAAEAAERRLKSAQARGTHASNPKRGRLAAQLEASKSAQRVPTSRQEEPLVISFIAVGLKSEVVVDVHPIAFSWFMCMIAVGRIQFLSEPAAPGPAGIDSTPN